MFCDIHNFTSEFYELSYTQILLKQSPTSLSVGHKTITTTWSSFFLDKEISHIKVFCLIFVLHGDSCNVTIFNNAKIIRREIC